MNELTRMAYLEALGIDSYVSRRQLPGAAITRRLAIKSASPPPSAAPQGASTVPAAGAAQRPVGVMPKPAVRARTETRPNSLPARERRVDAVPRFSLAAIVAGDWLWLEELAGMPLTSEQVQLVQAMAHAVHLHCTASDARQTLARPDVMQFDWPMHANRQLDQGEEAARAAVAGFLTRRLEQFGSRGLVLLGEAGAARVPVVELDIVTVRTASSADMLANPALKRQVWRDLQPLLQRH